MSHYAILLIEDQITITAQIVTELGSQLDHYRLSIARSVDEAEREHAPANVILLNLNLLGRDAAVTLDRLARLYPDAPIVLLAEGLAGADENLQRALSAGATDFVPISPAGLLVLGRRLGALQQAAQPTTTFGPSLFRQINRDQSDLAFQVIGPDNRVKAWNKTAESLFGIAQTDALNQRVDDLPLHAADLSRLKDVLDHARAVQQPFVIPQYSLGNMPDSWLLVHVYPIRHRFSESNGPIDICVVATQVMESDAISQNDLQINQDLRILLEANRAISGQLDLQTVLEKVIEQGKSLMFGDNCQIYLLEKDNKTLKPVLAVGPLADDISRVTLTVGRGVFGKAVTHGHATAINSAVDCPGIPYSADERLLCGPLTAAKGTIGLMVVSRRYSDFSRDDIHFFESLVQQASSAINNARLFEETQRSLIELETLYSASQAMATRWDNQDVLNTLVRHVVEAMNVSLGFIASWDKTRTSGLVEAVFTHPASPAGSPIHPGMFLDLSQRDNVTKMLDQQRPVFLDLSNPALDDFERAEMENYGAQSRLIVPLVTKAQTIGWLELWETEKERIFTADEVRLNRTLSSQIGVALQNAQYMKQTRQTLDEATALYRVASALTTRQDPQSIMSTVLQECLQALQLRQGSVVLFDFASKQGVVRIHLHDDQPAKNKAAADGRNTAGQRPGYKTLEGQQIPLSNNPVYERLMRTRQGVVISDPTAGWLIQQPHFAKNVQLPPVGGWGSEDAFSILVNPIKIQEEIVGVLTVENTRNNQPFNNWTRSLAQAMADQLGIGLQNVQLYEAEYLRREQAETLREVASIVSSSLHLNDVLERILDQLGRVIRFDSAAIHLIGETRRRVIAGRGFSQPERHIGLSFPAKLDNNEPGSVVIHNRQPAVHSNISEQYPSFKEEIHSHIKSWIGVPLIARDKVIGLITIDHTEVNAYSEEDVQMALAFADQVAVALENARLYEIEVRELERELEIAQQIQETLLPQAVPQIPGLDISGRIIPARQVGGDFFHFFSTGPGQLGVAIGDVSGKGIPAALYMAAGITAIDTQIEPDLLPGELLNRLNAKLYTRLHNNKMNIALQIATFIPFSQYENGHNEESNASLMTVASAGMIAPIGATPRGCRLLPVGALPVGAVPAPPQFYADDVFFIEPATAIVFSSDGIVEAQNETGELFGFDRLEETILEIVDSGNAAVIADHIIESVKTFAGHVEQSDDMTVVVVVKT